MTSLPNRFYRWIRHPSADTLASEPPRAGFEHLRGHKYCLLVTYRRSGEPVPTPVWFGLDGDAKLYVRSEADAAKVKRIRNDPHVRVAPCTVRGKPLGPPSEGRARVLDQTGDEARADAALRSNYGLGRKLYEAAGTRLAVGTVYLEVIAGLPEREQA
jgi:PPOX class probable F420-dependent enzyme